MNKSAATKQKPQAKSVNQRTYADLKKMWFDFFRDKSHTIIPSARITPENDPSTLFVTAGMQPLVPYLLGEKHPGGKRIANVQRCIRTNDIDEVGDDCHLTFFEMMGNWSLGDYFKREKVAWSYELLTSSRYLGIDKSRIHVTCFEGDSVAARDNECADQWKKAGIPENRIHFLPKCENWWAMSSGLGPQGPCSEMFYAAEPKRHCKNADSPHCNPACNKCGRFTELGNDVYMQYVVKNAGEVPFPNPQKNVDTGWGLERILCFINGQKSVYETEIFAPAIEIINRAGVTNARSSRIIAEHTRAAAVILSDGVAPSNSGAGYILRRLIRRAARNANSVGNDEQMFADLIKFYNSYLEFDCKKATDGFLTELTRFKATLAKGLREFEKLSSIDGKTAFYLFETYGFPIELTAEMAKERGITVDMAEFEKAAADHSQKSREAGAAAGMFKGGLADTSGETVRLHTLAHILLAALREKFGKDVVQKGSNITPERLRYDFSLPRKIEPDELKEIEKRVNEIIASDSAVTCEELSLQAARDSGAIGTFGDRYGDVVKVFTIGKFSREICGGPHVSRTGELGKAVIQKEESVGSGVRRIKAILVK